MVKPFDPQKPLKGAIIGFGFISGYGHWPAYLKRPEQDVHIIAIADVSEGRREIARKEVPGVKIYSDYQALLENETDLDFVDISTPPAFHAEIAHAAFERGLHVLCEKPLTSTPEQARALIKKAQESKRVLFPCHNYKHAPVVKTIQGIIESGKIGKVRSLTLNTFRNTHAKGVTEWDTHWRRKKEYSGGGIAMDHGSHSFYLTFDWLRSYPTAVTAKTHQLDSQWDTEDNMTAVLTFPTGSAHLHLSWTAGVRKVIYTVQGEKGAVTVDDDDLQLALMKTTKGPDISIGAVKWEVERRSIGSDWMDSSHTNWFNSLFDQFKEAIETQTFVGKEAKEAALCVDLIDAVYTSSKNHSREVSLRSDAYSQNSPQSTASSPRKIDLPKFLN